MDKYERWEPPPSIEVIDTGLAQPVGFIHFPEKRAQRPPVAEREPILWRWRLLRLFGH